METNGDKGEDFLIAEFETLREFRTNQLQQSEGRFNSFLFIFTGAIAVIALFIDRQDSDNLSAFALFTIISTSLLLIIGFQTYYRIIQTHMSAVRYTHGMNRIRKYFVETYSIKPYMAFKADPNYPPYASPGYRHILISGHAFLIMVFNAVLGIALFLSTEILLFELAGWMDKSYEMSGILIAGMFLILMIPMLILAHWITFKTLEKRSVDREAEADQERIQ